MSKTNRGKQGYWTAERVRTELPRGLASINVKGEVYPAVISGGLLPFAQVRADAPDMPYYEFAWSTIATALNTGSALVA